MIENSNITDTYKAEITEILSKISVGLSESVTAAIDPKIQDISSDVRLQNNLVETIRTENRETSEYLKERVENFGTSIKSIRSITENLEKSIEQRDLNVISSIENNTNLLSQLKKTYTDDLFSEIQKISNSEKNKFLETKIIELQTNQQITQKIMYVILVSLLILSSVIIFLILK